MSKKYLLSIALSILAITILSIFFEVTGLISYGLIVLSVWLAIAIIVIWCIFWVLLKTHLIKRLFHLLSSLKLSLILLITGFAGIAFENIYALPAVPSPALSINEQLSYVYKTDQGDRLALRFINLTERDQERLQRVIEILEKKETLSPENLYQAATILQHGTKSEHYELAYSLAKQSNEMGYENELYKAAYDRWMLSLGKPQKYGTQSTATFTLFGVQIEQK
jgi:hypothetical protein